MISPKYCEPYKFIGNQKEYPFSLPKQAFDDIKKSMEQSRQYIPASSFKSSWLALDVSNVNLLNLCHGISLSLQFSITENNLKEIEKSFENWFKFLDKMIAENRISDCVLRVNMHQLSHIPEMIRQCSILRGYSVRSMEREIDKIFRCVQKKKKIRSRVKSGENANIILERIALYSFMRNTEMLNFDSVGKQVGDSSNTFEYHPSGNKDYGQLWGSLLQRI
ncbi:hypothetical protein BD770DRAFT_386462 [Pilaira anomala]|nr:hypothetical protein BD770DRAFT_386462 [Pilaira anomala]